MKSSLWSILTFHILFLLFCQFSLAPFWTDSNFPPTFSTIPILFLTNSNISYFYGFFTHGYLFVNITKLTRFYNLCCRQLWRRILLHPGSSNSHSDWCGDWNALPGRQLLPGRHRSAAALPAGHVDQQHRAPHRPRMPAVPRRFLLQRHGAYWAVRLLLSELLLRSECFHLDA